VEICLKIVEDVDLRSEVCKLFRERKGDWRENIATDIDEKHMIQSKKHVSLFEQKIPLQNKKE